MEIKINGGKLFLDGKEISLKKDGGILLGENVLISACDLRVEGNHVQNITPEEFDELKGGAEE